MNTSQLLFKLNLGFPLIIKQFFFLLLAMLLCSVFTIPVFADTGETIIAPFTNGPNGATTNKSYSGSAIITVSGSGQAAAQQYSDAFYMFTDNSGNPVTPIHPPDYHFSLCINHQSVNDFVPSTPSYNSNHTYQFVISLPALQPLTFGICDISTYDNTGNFTVTVANQTLTATPTPTSPDTPTPTDTPVLTLTPTPNKKMPKPPISTNCGTIIGQKHCYVSAVQQFKNPSASGVSALFTEPTSLSVPQDGYSIGQLAIYSNGWILTKAIEFGWIVDPSAWKDQKPHLFIALRFVSSYGNYQWGGILNEKPELCFISSFPGRSSCPQNAYVQLSKSIKPGDAVGKTGHPQVYKVSYIADKKAWVIQYGNEKLGYVNESYFEIGGFAKGNGIEWFGEIAYKDTPCTAMGNGLYSINSMSASISNMAYQTMQNNNAVSISAEGKLLETDKRYWHGSDLLKHGSGFDGFHYGGPFGGPNNCSKPPISSPSLTPTQQVESNIDLLKQALIQYGEKAGTFEIEQPSILNDKYATGMVREYYNGNPTSGQGFDAEKVTGVWHIIGEYQQPPPCSDFTNYPDFPASLLPTCYDKASGQWINR